jgi:NAD(P)-dependent dehydrogenase (short-subunit alcohol dehydrogenase family)
MAKTILITGASSGFGELTAYQLADAGHIVYASMLDLSGHNADRVEKAGAYSTAHGVDIRTIELDVQDQASADAAVARVIGDQGRIDVLIHNAGHMAFGPAEAFTPEQFASLYDINVIGPQRLNRAALPHMRNSSGGPLMVWVGSTSTRGGTPPYIAPYFAAKAAMDSLAISYAGELARWGIETVIASPGVYTSGTNHFAHADLPADKARAAEYANGPTRDLAEQAKRADLASVPAGADVADVGRAIVKLIGMPFGTRPLRITIDPADGGADELNKLGNRVRAVYLHAAGMGDLLRPAMRGGGLALP